MNRVYELGEAKITSCEIHQTNQIYSELVELNKLFAEELKPLKL